MQNSNLTRRSLVVYGCSLIRQATRLSSAHIPTFYTADPSDASSSRRSEVEVNLRTPASAPAFVMLIARDETAESVHSYWPL